MADKLPAGFVKVDADQVAAPPQVMAPETWRHGGVCVYQGLREWQSQRQGEVTTHRMHVISPPGEIDPDDPNAYFGLWTTAGLDRLLEKVGKGEKIFLQYNGKIPHPNIRGKEMHSWTVARTEGAPPIVAKAEAEPLKAPAGELPAAFRNL